MKTSQSKFWDFGSVPMIEPEYLGSILAAGSDIAPNFSTVKKKKTK
jgi:hypothetical protein